MKSPYDIILKPIISEDSMEKNGRQEICIQSR